MEGPLLSAELLAPVVRRALDAPGAWPSEWSCEPLDWQIVNPSTAGLYRVVGTAAVDRGPPRPWRVVLKILHLPDLTGTPVESRLHRPTGGLELLEARGVGPPLRYPRPIQLAASASQVLGNRGRGRHDGLALARGARYFASSNRLVAPGTGRRGIRLGRLCGPGCRHPGRRSVRAVGGAHVGARLGRLVWRLGRRSRPGPRGLLAPSIGARASARVGTCCIRTAHGRR